MSDLTTIFAVILIALLVVLLILLFRVYLAYRNMENSFSKIGYIAREDTKKYFDETSRKALEMYQQSTSVNQNIVLSSIQKVVAESNKITEEYIAKAERYRSAILLEANKEAETIKKEAKLEAIKNYEHIVDQSALAIDWALSQYMKENFSISDHEEIIKKLIKIYSDERKLS